MDQAVFRSQASACRCIPYRSFESFIIKLAQGYSVFRLLILFAIRFYLEITLKKKLLLFSQFLNPYEVNHLRLIGVTIGRLVVYQHRKSVGFSLATTPYETRHKFNRCSILNGKNIYFRFCLKYNCMGLKKIQSTLNLHQKKKSVSNYSTVMHGALDLEKCNQYSASD